MARMRFTDQVCENLRYARGEAAPSGDIAHEDELYLGLLLRVRPSGLKSFRLLRNSHRSTTPSIRLPALRLST